MERELLQSKLQEAIISHQHDRQQLKNEYELFRQADQQSLSTLKQQLDEQHRREKEWDKERRQSEKMPLQLQLLDENAKLRQTLLETCRQLGTIHLEMGLGRLQTENGDDADLTILTGDVTVDRTEPSVMMLHFNTDDSIESIQSRLRVSLILIYGIIHGK